MNAAVLIVVLLTLFYALNLADGLPRLVARIGVVSAGVALGLSACGTPSTGWSSSER